MSNVHVSRENEAIQVIKMLVNLVYDLRPDEEHEDLYQLKHKIRQAQICIAMLEKQP